jgi:hypothetical protein
MIQTRHIKYGTISGLLLLCAIMLSTTEDSQRLVFAQISPAPEKAGSSSEPENNNSNDNNNDDSSGSSSGSNDDDNDDSSGSSSGSNDDDNDDSSGSSSGSNDDDNDGNSNNDSGHKKQENNQAISSTNACGNGEMPLNVGCQNTVSQIQGDENQVALTTQQAFPGPEA